MAKTQLRSLLAIHNLGPLPFTAIGVRACAWFAQQDFGSSGNWVRDELLLRLDHYRRQLALLDERLEHLGDQTPEVEALRDIPGVGLYTALLVIGELGEIQRFRTARQVGSYAGLTPRVHQSGDHCYRGSITRQGSAWLRWILVEAAIKAARKDSRLRNFYLRARKRSGVKIARVAVARKLAEICWKRLLAWHGRPVASTA